MKSGAKARHGGYLASTTSSLPIIGYILWHITLFSGLLYTLVDQHPMRHEPCGQSTHAWKYLLMNCLWTFSAVMSYCTFPGGGEGARARAVTLIIFHLTLCTWGLLMHIWMSRVCSQVLDDKFGIINPLIYVCIVHNAFFGCMFLFHELCLGEWLGFDATLIAEVRVRKSSYHSEPSHVPDLSSIKTTPMTKVSESSNQVYTSVPTNLMVDSNMMPPSEPVPTIRELRDVP